eukprot:GAHX01004091.1.p1 GENE.GAHX01004091.1~~GAHX01004091.1.p1  ORF type:complete len:171 (-),score=30.64 GAHX01004091.1:1404-1916(-)
MGILKLNRVWLIILMTSSISMTGKHLNNMKTILKEFNIDIFTEKRIRNFAKSLSIMEKSNIEQRKDMFTKILKLNFNNIKHFKNSITINFFNFPQDVKKKIVFEIGHPFVKQIMREFKTFVEEVNTDKPKEEPNGINNLISAVDFLSYTDSFPTMAKQLFSMLNFKRGDT